MKCRILLCLTVALSASSLLAVQPDKKTLESWEAYTASAVSRLKNSDASEWVDRDRAALATGRILVVAGPDGAIVAIHKGLIHHWVVELFVPHVSLGDVLLIVQDYDRFDVYYSPTVRRAATLTRGASDTYKVRYLQKAMFGTVSYDGEYETQYFHPAERRCQSVTFSKSIRQVLNWDSPKERLLEPDGGNGYLWRSAGLLDLLAADGGVYIRQESLVLSTVIPAGWRWLVEPLVARTAKSLANTWMAQTRRAVITASQRTPGIQSNGLSGQRRQIRTSDALMWPDPVRHAPGNRPHPKTASARAGPASV